MVYNVTTDRRDDDLDCCACKIKFLIGLVPLEPRILVEPSSNNRQSSVINGEAR